MSNFAIAQQAGLAARNSVDLCAPARETKSISVAGSPSIESLMPFAACSRGALLNYQLPNALRCE
jgi:hypothetical protein